jgi:hypothetical protein
MLSLLRRTLPALTMILLLALAPANASPRSVAQAAIVTDIDGPAGSGYFGNKGFVLPNGNIVVADSGYDAGDIANVGAVYLYDGVTFDLISTLKGSALDDQVGSKLILLSGGNFLVNSTSWDNGAATNAGAVTWCSAISGCAGAVSAANSLVGTAAGDQVGFGLILLANGNYVVRSPHWDNGAVANAGAATWCAGIAGCAGPVSQSNSLVGTTADDRISLGGILALINGNYVVHSPGWDNGPIIDAGAATWASGATGLVGAVSSANSLVGSHDNDNVGTRAGLVGAGNYIVISPTWHNGAIADAGAVTWGDGAVGRVGVVSSANSLVGAASGDQVGSGGHTVLSNGNYVVRSQKWDNGAIIDAGAATWGNGASGRVGVVSSTNSLVGASVDDQIGTFVIDLSNGNYVVCSPYWDNGALGNAGAATWGNGVSGSSGTISTTNSLVGGSQGDQVGLNGATALTNGNYVVNSYRWDNGAISDAGASTWGDGASGQVGVVSVANSLVGSSPDDQVGSSSMSLSTGDYVVNTSSWDNGAIGNVGAATWGDGHGGSSGVVSTTNSLVGSTSGDLVGRTVLALADGAYLVGSQNWDNGAIADVGAVTWCPAGGCAGSVSAANSLVGASSGDSIGSKEVAVLANGDYVILSPNWDNGAISNAGAVTWADGGAGSSGVVSTTNSLVGSTSGDKVGFSSLTHFSDSTAVVVSSNWDNGALADAGAATWSDSGAALTGPIPANPSSLGTGDLSGVGASVLGYDVDRRRLLIGWFFSNRVTVVDLPPLIRPIYLPLIKR